MDSKQTTLTSHDAKSSTFTTAARDLSDRLSDIELKLDHVIERIKDSLLHMPPKEGKEWEEKP